jgi:hypothetical protein
LAPCFFRVFFLLPFELFLLLLCFIQMVLLVYFIRIIFRVVEDSPTFNW